MAPGSDGAGEVIHVGERVTRFQPGDKVLAFLFQTDYFSNMPLTPTALQSSIGGAVDGTFREYGIFDQQGLVRMPSTLTYEQGATLGGAYLTAWNVLTGGARAIRTGDCVLVQGAGNVSIAVIQLDLAAGASAIATTSSQEKAAKLAELGATHVINYNQDKKWGTAAKNLSPGGLGCSHVVDVIGRADSFKESLEAVAAGGEIQVVGFLDTVTKQGITGPTFLDTLLRNCTVRGIASGSRQQFEEVLRAVELRKISPVIDRRLIYLSDLKAGYQYLNDKQHFGKVIVKII